MLSQLLRPASAIVLLISLSALLWGCGTPGRSYAKTGMQETLEVEILANASKMFVYRLKWPENTIPNHIRVAHNSRPNEPRHVGGVDVNRYTYERMQENAAYVVERMHYCREGFIELDRSISRYHLWLKGECKESANAADLATFGRQKTLPVNSDI
jgi:hypothetical protein